MFNRFDGKYGTFLTVLLIIAIIAILGLLIFFGYDMYRKYYRDSENAKVLEQFEEASKGPENTVNNDNNTTNEIDSGENPFGEVQGITGNTNKGNNNGVVMYEDYVVKGTIKIPKTNIEFPVLEKVTKRSIEIAVAIQYGPGVAEGNPTVNEVGNTVIIGHNYRNGMFFSNNKKLELGDKIYITDTSGNTFTYVIYNKYETTANDTDYMVRDTGGKREISLSTCTDDGNMRLIIWAREE